MESFSQERKQLDQKLSQVGYTTSIGVPYNKKNPYSTINLENKNEFYKPPQNNTTQYAIEQTLKKDATESSTQ